MFNQMNPMHGWTPAANEMMNGGMTNHGMSCLNGTSNFTESGLRDSFGRNDLVNNNYDYRIAQRHDFDLSVVKINRDSILDNQYKLIEPVIKLNDYLCPKVSLIDEYKPRLYTERILEPDFLGYKPLVIKDSKLPWM